MTKSSPSNQAEAEAAEDAPLKIEHLGLYGSYSPLEIATLAAGCRGGDLDARFKDAFGLLAHAEQLARLGPWGIESKDRIERGDPLAASPEKIKEDKQVQELQDNRITLAEKLRAEAKREQVTDKILRVPFMLQICSSIDARIKTEDHANRLYNEWLKYATKARANDLSKATMHRPAGPGSWLVDPSETIGGSSATESEIAGFKSRFESGRTAVLHDDEVAKWLAVDMFFWLESRPKQVEKKTIRSHKEGKEGEFASRKTKGARRNETGRFGKAI